MGGGFHLPPPPPASSASSVLSVRATRREQYMQHTRAEASYLFKYLIITQMVVYLEAGAIPCLLDQLSVDLDMSATQQGALGGVVYFALSAASPLCAYLLHRFNPQHVLGVSLLLNNVAMFVLAITPTGYALSANMMIFARGLVGFTQAFPCIYTPLWVDEYAPREKVAGWMSYLQGSVPMGVMLGYFVGTVSNWIVPEGFQWFQTWRLPFLVQFVAMCPILVAVFFVPKKHLIIRSERAGGDSKKTKKKHAKGTATASEFHDGTGDGVTASASSHSSEESDTSTAELIGEENRGLDAPDGGALHDAPAVVETNSPSRMHALSHHGLDPLLPATQVVVNEISSTGVSETSPLIGRHGPSDYGHAEVLGDSHGNNLVTTPVPPASLPLSSRARRSKRESRVSSSSESNRIITYLEEAIKLGTHPPLSWSGPNHEEEDVLLASASMFGGSSQRGLRQLHHNQQHQRIENEAGSASFRRSLAGSMISTTTSAAGGAEDNLSEMRRSPTGPRGSVAAFAAAARAPGSSSRVNDPPDASQVELGYGALDTVTAHTPLKSPTMTMLEASILEEEFIEVYEQGSFSEGLYELLRIPVFCLIVFGLTAVYFVVTGVQYWSTIFMIKSLHASKYLVNLLFVFVAGTGPIFGVFYGGWLIDHYGGYIGIEQRAKSLGICMVLGVIAFGISAATTFFNDIYITAAFLWLLLFFGGSILPACTGIFISVVPAQHRALASSFSVMIFNLVGYSLSPYLTGLVMTWVLEKQGTPGSYFEFCDEACAYRIGFRFCLFWSLWSFVCIGAAWWIARREAAQKALEELQSFPSFKTYPLASEA